MKYGLIYTKLQRPSVADDIVPRDRLIKHASGIIQQPLTLVSAPAGYGKSTLASSWMTELEYPYAWISLGESDNDPHLFLAYFLSAIRSLFSDAVLHSETLLDANPMPETSEVLHYLLEDLHQIQEPFVIVLDDYHCIHRGGPVDNLINKFLKYPPRTLHLVLLTREDPALPISSMRAARKVKEIRAADLRFTAEEVASFLNNMLDVVVDEPTASILATKIEGWAAGLRLCSLYLQGQKDIKQGIDKLSGRSFYIAEYLMAEVLSQQPPEMVTFLLETSILERFCVSLCHHMSQTESRNHGGSAPVSAEHFVQWLVDANIFVFRLDDKGDWFRYHHLFRDFLRAMLFKQRTADQIAELHRSAGKWFAKNDLHEEAIEYLVAGKNVSAATQLVIDHRYELLNTSQYVRLIRLLEKLPDKAVAESPLLNTMRAFIALDMGHDEDMYRCTQQAIQILEALSPESEIHAVLKGEILLLQSLIEMILGDAENSLGHAQEGLNEIPANAMLIRSLGFGVLSVCYQMMGSVDKAITTIKDALANPNLTANIQGRFYFYLSIFKYMDANLVGMAAASRDCLRVTRDYPFYHTQAFAHYFLGVERYLCNELEAAESYLTKVLDNRYSANPSYVVNAGFILVYIRLSQGNEVAADRFFDQIVAYSREAGKTTILSIIQSFEAEFALRRGDFQKACRICMDADFDARPPLWLIYVSQLTPIKCLLAEGTEDSLKNAHTRLIDWEEQMRRINRVSARIEILALLALVCYKQSDEVSAFEHLQTALKLAEPGRWIRIFVDLGDQMTGLLRHYNRQYAGQSFAQIVLQASQAEHAQQTVIKSDTSSEKQMSVLFNINALTEREAEIVSMLVEGLSNKEIAERLFISPLTVKTHLQNIYKKLGVKSRIEIIKKNQLT